ncbi:hypothetical protein [Umezawaea beigongshangensis]|uniref:hypothetical protein n=1 Tax=Umezawaea beigongshangensis TaxID=2780383 RepID=UPI0018F1E7BA|nr:hypothetical protein [Umezawaea beigongshangensis]
MTSDGSTPLGEPPIPDEPASLREFAERLQALRVWADVGPRALPGMVETERRKRGIPSHEVYTAYSTLHNLFQADRKRYDTTLLFDTIRALLRQGQQHPQKLEQQVEAWRRAFYRARAMPSRIASYLGFTLGPLNTGCRILEGNGERPIEEDDVRVICACR